MQDVNIGIVGLGNVGGGTLTILAENAAEIERKLGFRLNVTAVCSRTAKTKTLPAGIRPDLITADWRELVARPDVQIVAELIGGTGVAREVVEGAIAAGTVALPTVAGAVLLTLLFVPSTMFTEQISASRHPDFEDYRRSTPMFLGLPRHARAGNVTRA